MYYMLPTCGQAAASRAVAASRVVAASGAIAACGEVAGIYWKCTCWFKASGLREILLAWGCW